jgi:anti-sigma factor RsiW
MSCPRLEQSVFLHAHGQLNGVQSWLVESHLQHCTVCRARWAQWTVERDRLRRAFAPLPADPVGLTGLSAAVGARIRTERAFPEETSSRPRRPGLSRAPVAVALAVTLLAVAISALAAFWQPVVEHCHPPGWKPEPTPVSMNGPGNCPSTHNQPSNTPGAHRSAAPGAVPRP